MCNYAQSFNAEWQCIKLNLPWCKILQQKATYSLWLQGNSLINIPVAVIWLLSNLLFSLWNELIICHSSTFCYHSPSSQQSHFIQQIYSNWGDFVFLVMKKQAMPNGGENQTIFPIHILLHFTQSWCYTCSSFAVNNLVDMLVYFY